MHQIVPYNKNAVSSTEKLTLLALSLVSLMKVVTAVKMKREMITQGSIHLVSKPVAMIVVASNTTSIYKLSD